MTNTEIIQAIKAEIERLKKEELTRNSIGVITGSAFFVSANELLSFLSTLESEKPVPNDLEEAAWDCVLDSIDVNNPVLLPKYKELLTYLFIAGSKWQKQHDAELIEIAYNDGITIGMTKQKEQMMKEAVEGKVFMSFAPGHNQMVMADVDLPTNTKVRIIIVKED